MSGIYMVSAQKPTAVTHSCLGRITSERDLNLVICKSTLVEIYLVNSEGLKFIKQFQIWGVVENLNTVKAKSDKKDMILITTTRYDTMVLTCELNADGLTYDIITRAHGNFKNTIPRQSSIHMITAVDCTTKATPLIAIKCYDGVLKTIPLFHDSKQLDILNMAMDDLNVIDFQFLNCYENYTIGLVTKEPTNRLTFKIYEIENVITCKNLNKLVWSSDIADSQAFIIPVPEPCGGVIIVGTQSITYYNKLNKGSLPNQYYMIQKSPNFLNFGEINNYCKIDANGQRYILSTILGQLHMLILEYEEGMNYNYKVVDMRFEPLGEASIVDSMSYVDNGVIFLGSKFGDSQLIKLSEHKNEHGTHINVLETYTNLGPILDMLVVDIEKQGQGQLITCSGGHRNGSLRVIRSGIGIQENANVELPGIKTIWPLKISSNEYDDHLVLSFFNYTKIFSFFDEEFEDIELDGVDLQSQTLFCSNVAHDQIVQITPNAVRLLKIDNRSECKLKVVSSWSPEDDQLISLGTANTHQVLVAVRNELFYFKINDGALDLAKSVKLDHEIACLDISPFKENQVAELCAVGLWVDISIRLLRLDDLEQIHQEPIKGDVIPRSILIESLESVPYLFVSLGDGSVISFVIAKAKQDISDDSSKSFELTEQRRVVLGTLPTILRKFRSMKPVPSNNIFACSDRPSVISTTNQKLIYSSVNLKQVDYMCQINSKAYPYSLALISGGLLRIGTIDNIQKLHIRTVQLNETARRIAYQSETQTFGVVTFRIDLVTQKGELKPLTPCASTQCPNQLISKPSGGLITQKSSSVDANSDNSATNGLATSSKNAADVFGFDSSAQYDNTQIIYSFLILNQNTFEVMHAVQFQVSESVVSVLSMNFDNDPANNYYIVGTAYVIDDEPEPKAGRLLVFRYGENKLTQVCEKELKGTPYCMLNFNGKLLISVNNALKLFEFKDNQLNLLTTYPESIFILSLKCKNDFVLLGDVMKSCSLLNYRHDTNTFELVAKDHTPVWLNSIEIVDDDNFLIGDCYQNILSLRKDSGQSNEEERKCLQNNGCIHLGEQINIYRHGSLGMQQQSNEIFNTHFQGSILAGTVSGSIILFAQLSPLMFKILNELQTRLAKYISTAGKIQYDKWRDFESNKRNESYKNFIDGDLIESFLDLSPSEAAAVVKDFKVDNSTVGHTDEEYGVSYFTKLVEELSRIH